MRGSFESSFHSEGNCAAGTCDCDDVLFSYVSVHFYENAPFPLLLRGRPEKKNGVKISRPLPPLSRMRDRWRAWADAVRSRSAALRLLCDRGSDDDLMRAVVVCAHLGAWRDGSMERAGRRLLHAAHVPMRRRPVDVEDLRTRAADAYDRLARAHARPTLAERLDQYPCD
jgi:hypothetical protein